MESKDLLRSCYLTDKDQWYAFHGIHWPPPTPRWRAWLARRLHSLAERLDPWLRLG